MQMSFGFLKLAQRLKQNNVLMKIGALNEWGALRPMLTGLYKRELSNGGGQKPFGVLMMLKAILLGQWHSLSDAIPDETALCWFRNRLVVNDRLDGLLASINEQIQSHGLMIV